MWRNKKVIIVAVLTIALLAGSIGGVVLAADDGDNSQPKAQGGDILEKVCAIYQQNTGVAIDQEALKAAFAQAQSEMQKEREQARLQGLVEQGKLTQEQADKYLEWWQSRPDVPFGFPGHGGFRGAGGPPCAPAPAE